MQVPEFGPRRDAEFGHQHLAGLLVGHQGLGLSARARQREHQLGAKAFPQRVLVDQAGQPRDDLVVVALATWFGLDLPLDNLGALPIEVGQPRVAQQLTRDVDQRGAAPQGQRAAGDLDRRSPFARAHTERGLLVQDIEGQRVQLVRVDPNQITGIPGEDARGHLRSEALPQPCHVRPQRAHGPGRRRAVPDELGHRLGIRRLVGARQQQEVGKIR